MGEPHVHASPLLIWRAAVAQNLWAHTSHVLMAVRCTHDMRPVRMRTRTLYAPLIGRLATLPNANIATLSTHATCLPTVKLLQK